MRTKLIALFFVLIALSGGLYWLWTLHRAEAPLATDPSIKFALVEAADRSFEGAPALALTFSQPLDAGKHYEKFIQVFEMPPRNETEAQAQAQHTNNDEDDLNDSASNPPALNTTVSTAAADTDFKDGKVVNGAWVVGENPRLLFFPHIKPQTRYIIRVQPTLQAKNQSSIGAEARYSVVTAAVAPAYYFASRGMVLPAKQNGGLPVVTVNIPEVDVQFLRIKNQNLPEFLDQVISGKPKQQAKLEIAAGEDGAEESDYTYYDPSRSIRGAVSHYELDKLHKLSDSVYLGRFLTEQKQNKRSVTYIPVEDIHELQEPGVYVAIMTQPGRFRYEYQTTYFYVSDIGLHLRVFDKSADAFVSSLTNGKAIPAVEVSMLDQQGKVLALARTDNTGRAHFAERPKGAKVVLARTGKQVSMIALKEPALDLSEYDITGAPYKPVRLFAYSGRNLYRPGERFDLSVLARGADGQPVAVQPIQAILKRPDGHTHFTATWQPDSRFPGYYLRQLDLPADAPTGFWSLELRADPADKVPASVLRFGVEEFLPERMKLDLSSQQALLAPDSTFTIDVLGSYLYGAPAAGNRLIGVAQFERNRNPLLKKLPGFEFGDFAEDDAKTRVELAEGALDEQGKAVLNVDLAPVVKRHSPFSVRATMSLLESGGRPIVRTLERVVWPAPALIGVRPLFLGEYARENAPVEFEVVRADADGKLSAAKALPVRLFREDRNYYWRFEDQRGWHSGFTETDELVETRSVSIPAGGRGKLVLPVRYGRYRVEILDPETQQTLRYRFYAGWSAKENEAQGVRPDRVALKLDKPAYREGETAKLTITPPHAGEALVTVEGDRTLLVKRLAVSDQATTIELPIAKDWQRHDLYVSVIVLRPGNAGDRVTPARALGIVHLPLQRAERKLNVTLEAPAKIRPDTLLKIKVKVPEAKSQKAMVTLSAVDVGILNITRFASPDPHAFYFDKLRYGADQYDIYGRLIEKMQGQKGRLKFGGDNTPKATRSLPKKVKLIDLFSGPIQLDAKGEAEITLPIPDFNGSLRLMAVVATPTSYGSKDTEVTVAAPLVAELATPRFLAFGDKAIIALDLHNLSGIEQKLAIAIKPDQGLRILDAQRNVTLPDQQKVTLRFPVEAANAFGLVNIVVKVDGKDIQLQRNFPLMVQSATPQQQFTKRFSIEPGATLDIRDGELSGLYRESALAHVTLSDKPPIDVRSAIQGLLTYPYGCAEQTTSTAYPHVFVDEESARRFGLKPYSREQRAQLLEGAISRIAAMQAPNGGYSLWGNAGEYEYWLSAYVTSFLQDAREQNFGVPDAMYNKSIDFLLRGLQDGIAGLPAKPIQRGALEEPRYWDNVRQRETGRFSVLAFGGYVLARESKAPLATLRQLYDVRANAHSGLSLVQLGIALRLMGDQQRGNSAIAEGLKKGRDSGYWWGDYGSPLRDTALSYALLDRHKLNPEGMGNLLPLLATEMQNHRYLSTQEKMALFLVGRAFTSSDGSEWTAQLLASGKPEKIGGKGAYFHELTAAALSGGVKINNVNKERLYVELALSGNPIKPLTVRNDPIVLSRSLFDPEGKAIDNRPLQVGESIWVHLVARSKTLIANGLVVDRIPAGLEIENFNIVQGEQANVIKVANLNPADAMRDPRIQHVEFRDDRFVAAVRLDNNDLHLFYRARVVTPGKFVMPALYAEDMYRPDTFGTTAGGETLSVIEAKSTATKEKTKVK